MLSSKRPGANGSYGAAGLRHNARLDSRSAPRITSRASPSVLEITKMLQHLIHSFRHTEVLKVRHEDRLLPAFCILPCLFHH